MMSACGQCTKKVGSRSRWSGTEGGYSTWRVAGRAHTATHTHTFEIGDSDHGRLGLAALRQGEELHLLELLLQPLHHLAFVRLFTAHRPRRIAHRAHLLLELPDVLLQGSLPQPCLLQLLFSRQQLPRALRCHGFVKRCAIHLQCNAIQENGAQRKREVSRLHVRARDKRRAQYKNKQKQK